MMRFLDFLFPPRVDELSVRDIDADAFLALLAPRLAAPTRPETVVLLPFADTRVRATLHEAKYHGSEHAFSLLGGALADFLPEYVSETRFSLATRLNLVSIVPVPLGKKRLKERGFNQVEEIAKRALRLLGTDVPFSLENDLLARTRETPSQVSLAREQREKNMRGAFRVAQDAALNPAHLYILLDDVLTTGATLQAAIDTLRAAGAEHILPIALAH